jgi:hypothetical protein
MSGLLTRARSFVRTSQVRMDALQVPCDQLPDASRQRRLQVRTALPCGPAIRYRSHAGHLSRERPRSPRRV